MNMQKLAEEIYFQLLVKKLEEVDYVVQIIGKKNLDDNIKNTIEDKYQTNNIFYFTTIDESWDTVLIPQAVLLDCAVIIRDDEIVEILEGDKLEAFHKYAKNNFHHHTTGLDVYDGFIQMDFSSSIIEI